MLDTAKVSHFFAVDGNAAIQHAGGKTQCLERDKYKVSV